MPTGQDLDDRLGHPGQPRAHPDRRSYRHPDQSGDDHDHDDPGKSDRAEPDARAEGAKSDRSPQVGERGHGAPREQATHDHPEDQVSVFRRTGLVAGYSERPNGRVTLSSARPTGPSTTARFWCRCDRRSRSRTTLRAASATSDCSILNLSDQATGYAAPVCADLRSEDTHHRPF